MKQLSAALSGLLFLAACDDSKPDFTPTVNGIELPIYCERDFPDGKPSLDFLERFDNTVFHPDGRQGSVSALKNPPENIHPMFQAIANGYERAKQKGTDAEIDFVIKMLKAQHRDTFPNELLPGAMQRCDSLG